MNLEQQMEPGDGADGKLADATVDDLISELKSRCTCMAAVMVVTDSDGEEVLIVKTLGPRLAMLGAAEVIKQHYLEMDIKQAIDS